MIKMQTLPSNTQAPMQVPLVHRARLHLTLPKSHILPKRFVRKATVTSAQLGSQNVTAASVATREVKADGPSVALTEEGNVKLPKFTQVHQTMCKLFYFIHSGRKAGPA